MELKLLVLMKSALPMKIKKKKIRRNNCHGQSLIEIIIAMAIFSLITVSMVSLVLGGFALSLEGGRFTEADLLSQEALEAVRSIKERAWNEVVYSKSAIIASGTKWALAGEGTQELISGFTREIYFYPIYRNSNGDIVSATTSGAYLDVERKRVRVNITWDTNRGLTNRVDRSVYFTNWDSFRWSQSDWSGGDGQAQWQNEDQYWADDGNIDDSASGTIMLLEISTSTYATSGYLESSAFNTGTTSTFTVIGFDGVLPPLCSGCEIQLQIKTAPDQNGSPGVWSSTWCGPEGEDGDEDDYYASSTGAIIHYNHNNDQWIKYKAILIGEAFYTPELNEVYVKHK